MEDFTFLPCEGMTDGEITLTPDKTLPADPAKGYVPSYEFVITGADGQALGNICLRVGDNENTYYGGHIGYMVRPQHRGHRYAAKACRLIFQLARRHGMGGVVLTVNPQNLPSRRTCEILGARLLEVVDIPETQEMYAEGERQKCRYEVAL